MIKSQMEQQLSVLKELDDLIARSDEEGNTGTASAETEADDLSFLD